jgi:hypothetical protein
VASRGDRTGLNRKMFEHQSLHSKPVIPSNKPTAELDDGLAKKEKSGRQDTVRTFSFWRSCDVDGRNFCRQCTYDNWLMNFQRAELHKLASDDRGHSWPVAQERSLNRLRS